MRILFAVPRYHTNHEGMTAGLIGAGHEVAFLVREPSARGPRRADVPMTPLPKRLGDPLRFALGFLGATRPDVVVARNASRTSGAIFLASRLLGIRFLLYVQYPDGYESLGPWRRLRLRLGLWPVHTVNAAVQSPARQIPGKTLDFLPFAVEPGPEKTAYPAALPIRVLSVGKLDQERKNHVPVVRHLAPLLRAGAIELTIIGARAPEPSPAWQALVAEMARQEVGPRVRLLENFDYDRTRALYPEHDLFLLASSRERAAISPLEAMASGLPVVAGSDNGTNYAIRPDETGFVFPDGDFAAMAERVGALAAAPAALERMGRAARRLIADEYAPADYARRFEAVLARRFPDFPAPLPSLRKLG